MQIVIGLVGPIASGKGTISEYLKSQGFVYFSLSDVVREITNQKINIMGVNTRTSKFLSFFKFHFSTLLSIFGISTNSVYSDLAINNAALSHIRKLPRYNG